MPHLQQHTSLSHSSVMFYNKSMVTLAYLAVVLIEDPPVGGSDINKAKAFSQVEFTSEVALIFGLVGSRSGWGGLPISSALLVWVVSPSSASPPCTTSVPAASFTSAVLVLVVVGVVRAPRLGGGRRVGAYDARYPLERLQGTGEVTNLLRKGGRPPRPRAGSPPRCGGDLLGDWLRCALGERDSLDGLRGQDRLDVSALGGSRVRAYTRLLPYHTSKVCT